YKTTDTGRTWTDITGNLPEYGWVHIVREDRKNPNLLYAGTELGLFVSYTGGGAWIPLEARNLPHVAVRDVAIHPREHDLMLATHGRSILIMDDVTAVQQMDASIASQDLVLFDVRPALRFTQRFQKYGTGDKQWFGPNPPYGAIVTYYLKAKPDDKTTLKLQVLDSSGKMIREVKTLPREKGINRAAWDLRVDGPRVRRPPTEEETAFFGGPSGPRVLSGTYTIRLALGDKTVEKKVEVRLDPTISVSNADLQEQYNDAIKLRDMQSTLTDGARLLDSIKEQLQNI